MIPALDLLRFGARLIAELPVDRDELAERLEGERIALARMVEIVQMQTVTVEALEAALAVAEPEPGPPAEA